MSPQCLPSSFSLIWLTVPEQMSFQDFQPWRPSWILEWNEFSNSKSPCHSNASNQGWDLPFGSRHGLKIFKRPPWGASWISEWNDFSNSESLCCSEPPINFQFNTTYNVRGEVVWRFWHGGHLGYWNGTILALLNLHVPPMPPTEFGLNLT